MIDGHRVSNMTTLKELVETKPVRERLIRCLEFRQMLIDECIDRSIKYAKDHPESKICGFDARIVTEWIPSSPEFLDSFDSKEIANYFASQQHLSPTSPGGGNVGDDDDTMEDARVENTGFNESVCKNTGKCLFHQGWELIKSREAELEVREEIKLYCLEKQKEVEIFLRLMPLGALKNQPGVLVGQP